MRQHNIFLWEMRLSRMSLVITYHPFNTQIKRFVLQNSRIQQTRDIFPQPPSVAYKRDLSLRNMLVHSTDHSCTEQCGSRACQRPRCRYEVLNAIFLSVTVSPASPVVFILVRPDGAPGVVLANTYEVYAITLLGSLWPNISTPWKTVFRYPGRGM